MTLPGLDKLAEGWSRRLSGKQTFATLDGLRGVAAIAVVIRHTPGSFSWLPSSHLAVDLFFVLSGFVLAHSYGEKLRDGLPAVRFLVLRFLRLWPLYLVGTAAMAAVLVLATPEGFSHPRLQGAPFALLMLPTPPALTVLDRLYPLNGPAWSLLVELGVNALFALIAARLGWRMLAAVLAAGAVLLLATIAAYGNLDVGGRWSDAAGGGGRVLYGFFAGVALHRLRGSWTATHTVPAYAWPVLLLLVMSLPAGQLRPLFDAVAVLLVFPAVVFLAASREPGRARGVFLALGRISFPLYMIHSAVIVLAQAVARERYGVELQALGPGVVVLVLAASLAAAAGLAELDTRLRAGLRRRPGLQPRAAAA